jgi:hypothetical protein
MRVWIFSCVAFLTVATLGSHAASACGDKFLMIGRAVQFQHAYAAIHPGSILIVLPSKSVKYAAVRDSRLQSALKMAGHHVEAVPQANVAAAFARSRYDIVLAERADALTLPDALAADGAKPAIIGVLEDAAPAAVSVARHQFDAVLTTPQPLPDILRLLDDVMKTRPPKARG